MEPQFRAEYGGRQVEAAHRVLVDVGQVLGSFRDCLVVVGGWVPDLLVPDAADKHIGSIDVDLALDAARLGDGRYADLLKLLLETRRYRMGEKTFQLVTEVDLAEGGPVIAVELDLLASKQVKLRKNKPKLVKGFRVLQFAACEAAFVEPVETEIAGRMVNGAENQVRLRVASLPSFLIMKAHAIGDRDKPKDVYDLCYCIEVYPGGIAALGEAWRGRGGEPLLDGAIRVLEEKFGSVNHFGPQQLVRFHNSGDREEEERQARRAYELVQAVLGRVRR